MARIVSFSHTTAALVNRHKTMTTRSWKPEYAVKFKAGDEILAYDKSPRCGGKPVARLRLTADVLLCDPQHFTRDDFQREGFGFLAATGELAKCIGSVRAGPLTLKALSDDPLSLWMIFKRSGPLYVVRFEVLELLPGAEPFVRPGVEVVELPEDVT